MRQSSPQAPLQSLGAAGVLQGLPQPTAALPGGREPLGSRPLGGGCLPEGGEEPIEQAGACGAIGLWSTRSLGSGGSSSWALEIPWQVLCRLLSLA